MRMPIRPSLITILVATSLQTRAQQTLGTDSTTLSPRLGSGERITEKHMNKGLVTNPLEALSGQAAGVSVSSSGSDRMAMLSAVRVRGTTSLTGGNDPLVIIDGISSDLATLSTIYPADIESFTILKNASETAQYGTRGASGVIQVATKRGHEGKFHISYDGNFGFESVYKSIDMLRREGYISTAKRLALNYSDGGYDTHFQKEITRTGFVQNHHIAFSGGTEQSNYRASVGFMDHERVVKINKHQNFVAKIDLMQSAFDGLLKIDLGVFGSSQKAWNIFDKQKLFYSAATQNPTFPYGRDADGNWNKNATASQINPPAALLEEKNDEKSLHFNTHIKLFFALARNLNLSLFGSYSYNSMENALFCPTWLWAQGQAYRGEQKTEALLGNVMLDYKYSTGPHTIDFSLLGEYQRKDLSGFWTLVQGFTNNAFGYNNLGAGSIFPYGGTGSKIESPALASGMGNVGYTLMERYKVNLTLRADGSSMVGKHNRWGLFPSVSAEWDVRKESFFSSVPLRIISQCKLRTGYGESGNLGGISPFNSLQLLSPNGVVPYNGSSTITMGLLRNVNPDLKWETRGTFNIGADLGFWNNRIIMTAEYYHSKTRDMLYLYDVPAPPFAYDKLLANIGSMSNSGIELGLGLTPIQKRDMELNVNVNIAFQKNKILSLSGEYNGTRMSAPDITSIGQLNGAGFHGGNNNIVYQIVGQPLGVFYLPHCTGLKKNADGSYSYQIEDLDHSGGINIEDGGDRYIAGQATPKMTMGSNISFRYKDFDISLQLNGAFGHKIYNGTALTYMNMGSFPDYNVMSAAPRENIKDQTATDYWLERGDYLNIDYLTFGWNVPMKSRHISMLRLSCSVNNLLTITGYSGLSPMINSYIADNTLGIDDKRSYPPYRSFSLALSIQF